MGRIPYDIELTAGPPCDQARITFRRMRQFEFHRIRIMSAVPTGPTTESRLGDT